MHCTNVFKQVFTGFIISLLLAGCNQNPGQEDGKKSSISSSESEIEASHPNTPEAVVHMFCSDFFKSAPPMGDTMAARRAYNLLTDQAQLRLNNVRAGIANRLALFAGVQDIPDNGFRILGIITEDEGVARVKTSWLYSEGAFSEEGTEKVFSLNKQDGLWKISDIH